MAGAWDREAFLAAVQAAAKPRIVGVTLAGVGACWVRPLTAGDWINAQAAQNALKGHGVEVTPALRMAIGLAQNLCGPEGEALFDLNNRDHLNTLAALPMDSVQAALIEAGRLRDAAAGDPGPNA